MEHKHFVAYCGLYCRLCEHHARIPQRAAVFKEAMQKADYEDFGSRMPDFDEFWRFLQRLTSVEDRKCCRTEECGAPFCAIRKCAMQRDVEMCPECEEYPCERVKTFAKGEPTLLHDGQRIREKGLDAWVEEQEGRRKAGFCYADIRCYPYYIPRDSD